MARFLALHAARADAKGMIDQLDKFAQVRDARPSCGDYLQGAADGGELRIFELEIGGAVVASRVAFLIASDLYLYFAGYDPAWKSYSVMTVLMTEVLKWALAHGVERVNLSTGRDQSKERWKPREVLFGSAVQISPTWRARTAFGPFRADEALGRARVRPGERYGCRSASPSISAAHWSANLRSDPAFRRFQAYETMDRARFRPAAASVTASSSKRAQRSYPRRHCVTRPLERPLRSGVARFPQR